MIELVVDGDWIELRGSGGNSDLQYRNYGSTRYDEATMTLGVSMDGIGRNGMEMDWIPLLPAPGTGTELVFTACC